MGPRCVVAAAALAGLIFRYARDTPCWRGAGTVRDRSVAITRAPPARAIARDDAEAAPRRILADFLTARAARRAMGPRVRTAGDRCVRTGTAVPAR